MAKNGFRISSGWLSFVGSLVVKLVIAGMAYGAFTSEIKHVKKDVQKLDDVRERLVRVETRQEAQGVTLDRIDKAIQRMAAKK